MYFVDNVEINYNLPKFCPKCGNKVQGEIKFCKKCGFGLTIKNREHSKTEEPLKPGEVKCLFCNKFFNPITSTPTSTGGNIVRGAVFLPWGVVSALKNKPYVRCPHCGMKIQQ
jgi:DNA-directed RNA polymerase subunit RPC12/RpoP/ribosomal protein L37E